MDQTVYPTTDVANGLRNLREFLPERSQLLYRFAAHVANMFNEGLYPAGFCATAMNELRYAQGEPLPSCCGHPPIPRKLTGHSPDAYASLFDAIPEMFSAVTTGDLERSILEEYRERRRDYVERLDPINGSILRAARSGTEFERDELERVFIPMEVQQHEVQRIAQLPPYLPLTAFSVIPRGAVYFKPIPPAPRQYLWAVVLMKPTEQTVRA